MPHRKSSSFLPAPALDPHLHPTPSTNPTTSLCCTCGQSATTAGPEPPSYATYDDDEKRPQPTPSTSPASDPPRRLDCCDRLICARCIARNKRFCTYCPFCQIASPGTDAGRQGRRAPLIPDGLREPPAYEDQSQSQSQSQSASTAASSPADSSDEQPPAYSATAPQGARSAPEPVPVADTVHHLRPTETLTSLSLAYRVPKSILQRHNSLFADSLLPARKTVNIPGGYYSGPSLSGEPVEDPEAERRRVGIRRFMVSTKVVDYEVARVYWEASGGDGRAAVDRWEEDERWERENPFAGRGSGGSGRGGVGLVGQLR